MVEFLQFYRHFANKEPLQLKAPVPYENYIYWLEQQNSFQPKEFWKKKLKGFNQPTDLGIYQAGRFKLESQVISKDVITQLDQQTTILLHSIANQYEVTLNTLLQGAWAHTLALYSNNDDVIFGITVAGRPAELSGIESMVGLFINTLPLRCQSDLSQELNEWFQQYFCFRKCALR